MQVSKLNLSKKVYLRCGFAVWICVVIGQDMFSSVQNSPLRSLFYTSDNPLALPKVGGKNRPTVDFFEESF